MALSIEIELDLILFFELLFCLNAKESIFLDLSIEFSFKKGEFSGIKCLITVNVIKFYC